MVEVVERVLKVVVCLVPLLCVSCLTMTMPKSARIEPLSSKSTTGTGTSDKRLVDTWELLSRAGEDGAEELPAEGTRTLIEFTDKGRVIFNRVDKDDSDVTRSRKGTYSAEKNEITITDDMGNTAKWTYNITGDKLVIFAPEAKKKFNWRRFR